MTYRTGVLQIAPTELACLAAFVEEALEAKGCDGTLRHTEQWATRHGVDAPRLATGLKGLGGFCDCEVLVNCLPADLLEEPDDSDW